MRVEFLTPTALSNNHGAVILIGLLFLKLAYCFAAGGKGKKNLLLTILAQQSQHLGNNWSLNYNLLKKFK